MVDVNAVKRVKSALQVDITDLESLAKVDSDPCLLVDVIYCVVRPECEARGVTDEQFGAAIGSGDVLKDASEKLIEAITDFFPDPQKRKILRAIVAKSKAILPELESKAMTAIEELTADKLVGSLT